MIISRLVGGLGNQMFQYASAYAVAKHNSTDLLLDTSWFEEKNSAVWTMKYELECFNITARSISNKSYKTTDNIKAARHKLFNKNIYFEYKEKSLLFDDNVFSVGKNVVMDGYWQSEKYFARYRDNILKEFTFASESKSNFLSQIVNSNAISLHVRRGDYASHQQTNSFHGLMGLDYYQAAIESIASKVKNPVFFIFSDEPEWCRDNITINHPTVYVSGNKGEEDMQLMSRCKHHIIANSSFSWWGAWLNPSNDKIVIAPKRWFNDPSGNSSDLVPAAWERI